MLQSTLALPSGGRFFVLFFRFNPFSLAISKFGLQSDFLSFLAKSLRMAFINLGGLMQIILFIFTSFFIKI